MSAISSRATSALFGADYAARCISSRLAASMLSRSTIVCRNAVARRLQSTMTAGHTSTAREILVFQHPQVASFSSKQATKLEVSKVTQELAKSSSTSQTHGKSTR